jgi:uroporphyrinogen-III synthase
MAKAVKKITTTSNTGIKNILIAQPKPETEKSPYFDIALKHKVQVDFYPFITLVGIDYKDFRKQKIDILKHSSVIFTSRNAIDHFFRICEELKIQVSQDTKYFCITESVALYLQKFILYRKRKVFYGADGTNKSMFDSVTKHIENEKFIYPCSENQQDGEIVNWLKQNNCEFTTAFMYRTENTDVKSFVAKKNYDVICLFTPSGVKSLFENFPNYKQKNTLIGTFGKNTLKAAEDAGLKCQIIAPMPATPSMTGAIEHYLSENK